METLKLLHNSSKDGFSGRLFALVVYRLVLVLEDRAQLVFCQRLDNQGEGHDQGQGLDPLGLFDS